MRFNSEFKGLISFVTCILRPVIPLLLVIHVCHPHPRYPDPYTCFVLVNIYHLTSSTLALTSDTCYTRGPRSPDFVAQ